jgi:PST family polysaccharide transporter
MALHPLAANLNLVPRSILRRQMRFGAASVAEVAGLVIGSGGAVILAFRGAGAFSLVFQLVASHTVTALVGTVMAGWYPRFRWSRASASSLWAYGWAVTGFDVSTQLEGQLAPFLIGRFLGNTAVGFYTRGYSLILGPVRLLGDTIWQVMLSALSLIQDDLERVRSAFSRAVALLIFVLAPAMVGTALVADALVPFVLGDQWVDLIPVVQAMTVAGLLSSAIGATYWLHTSLNTTGRLFSFGVVRFIVVALFVGGALLSGSIVTVAWAFAASQAVLLVLAYRLTRWLFDIGLLDLFVAVRGGVASSVAMGLVVWSVRPLLGEVSVGIDLGVRILVGVVVYVALGSVLARKEVRELRDMAARFGVGSTRA